MPTTILEKNAGVVTRQNDGDIRITFNTEQPGIKQLVLQDDIEIVGKFLKEAVQEIVKTKSPADTTKKPTIILDFTGIDVISSSAISKFVTTNRNAEAANLDVEIRNASESVMKILHQVKMKKIMPISANEESGRIEGRQI